MNTSMRLKILFLVTVPTLAVFILSGLILLETRHDLQVTESMQFNTELFEKASGVANELQRERGRSAMFASGALALEEVEKQRKLVDSAVASFDSALTRVNLPTHASWNSQSWKQTLEATRTLVGGKEPAPKFIPKYTEMIFNLLQLQVQIADISGLEGVSGPLRSLTILEAAKESSGQLRAQLSSILSLNQPLTDAQFKKINTLFAGISVNLFSPALVVRPDARKSIDTLTSREEFKHVETVFTKVLRLAEHGKYGEDPKFFFTEITKVVDAINVPIKQEVQLIYNTIQTASAEKSARLNWVTIALLLLITCIATLAFFMIRMIVVPIRRIITDISGSSDQLSQAAEQMAATSQVMSSAAQQQASAIEQTSASLTEIESMVDANTNGAEQAQEHLAEVHSISENTRKSMEQLKSAMESILQSNARIEALAKSVEEIGEKTEVIDDIVLKTQLLSFNASVEAERAGEHGRGFSVVAQEVGNLAQLSGNAAAEIAKIVKKSMRDAAEVASENKTRVETGVTLTNTTREKLTEVLNKLSTVLENTRKIVSASKEQRQGIGQITSAIDSLNQSTQQNASTAEESEGASAEVSAQAASLMNMVQELTVLVNGGNSAAQASAPASLLTPRQEPVEERTNLDASA